MIDIENDVFDVVAKAVKGEYPTACVSGEYDDSPASFPAVTIVEADNTVVERMRTENIENAANIMYEINVYSSRVASKKAEAKAIADLIDSVLTERGFTRVMRSQVPNLANAKVYRILARYRAIVGPNGPNNYLIYHSSGA